MPATVSVIVPNYNHARYLRKRVQSVLGQTCRDFEVILLDDCSTDESRDILKSYASDRRIRMELNEKNSGSTFKQWNKGVKMACGKYVWIAESDDYADERLLERLVKILEDEPQVVLAYCRSWQVSSDEQEEGFGDAYLDYYDAKRWKSDFIADGQRECRDYFVRTNPVTNASAALFRKSVYEEVGGADESLRLCGDWKLWAAMALKGKIAYVSEPLNYYRIHDTSVRIASKRGAFGTVEALRVIRWITEHQEPTVAGWKSLRQSAARYWPWELLRRDISLRDKREIYRKARAIDPGASLRLLRAAWVIFWLKMSKEYRLFRQRLEVKHFC